MDAVEFFKEKRRMCVSFGGDSCTGCLINMMKGVLRCPQFCEKYSERAVDIVETWAKEHPRETRKDDFFEKFPYAKKLSDGTPEVCAAKVGYLRECPHPNVEDYCKECWNTALEE